MEKEKHLQTSKHPFFFLIPAVCFFPGSKEGWRWFLPRLLENCWPRRPEFYLWTTVVDASCFEKRNFTRQNRSPAEQMHCWCQVAESVMARIVSCWAQRITSWASTPIFGRIRVSRITPRLHLPSSGFLTSFHHVPDLTRNLLSWNLTRALRWKIRCLGSPNISFACLQQARNSLFQG